MLKIIEDKNFLSKTNKKFIKHVFSSFFPFFYHKSTDSGIKDDPYLAHIVIKRPEMRKKTEPYLNSPHYYKDVVDILNNFTRKNNITYKEILRASFNFSYANGKKTCGWHTDHDFPHWQLVVYLNDCDKDSFTVLKENNKTINIKPAKYKGVCFTRVKHRMIFPKQKERVILVITFR